MNYNIWFDVCALLLMSFLLLQFVLRRAFNIFQSNTFLLMMIGMWYASFFSLLTIVLEGKSYIFVLITNYLVIIVDGLVGAFFVIYVLSIINYKEYKRLAITTVLVPIVSMVVLLTLNVFLNDFLFTVDKEKAVYVSGNYLVLLYIFVYLHYVFAVFNIFITNRKFISKELKLISPLMLITAIAGVIVELINPTLVVQQFVLSLLVLDAYFSLQNPNEFFDEGSGLYNEKAFVALCSKLITSKKNPMRCIAICVHDIESVLSFLGHSRVRAVEEKTKKQFINYIHNCKIFKFADGKYLIVLESSKYDVAQRSLDVVLKGLESYKTSCSVCLFECPKHSTSLEGIRKIMSSVLSYGMEKNLSVVNIDDLKLHQEEYLYSIENTVLHAVENDAVDFFIQPLYSTQSNNFFSAEALLRMRAEDGKLLLPDSFMVTAERTGSIVSVGACVFAELCRFISANELEKTSLQFISMNLCVIELLQNNIVSNVKSVLEKYHVSPSFICFEISEDVFSAKDKIVEENIRALNELGINFILDDFGSGKTTLMRILDFPIVSIKLKRNMVSEAFIGGNRNARILLESSMDIIRRLGCNIIAKGVETDSCAKGISVLGATLIQGFYYSKPVSRKDFVSLIKHT